MSLSATCKTQITDVKALVDVLVELLGKDAVKVKTGAYSSTNKKIEVEVKPSALYGTAGYYKNKNGTYSLVYDTMDRKALAKILPKKINNVTVDPVSKTYAYHRVMASIRSLKGRVVQNTTEQDGTIRLKVKINHY